MPRLTGVMHRLGGRPGDRGAVAALVGLLLAGGVLLGMAALVVDVGLLYAEREELQTGADAAAVAVAKACATRPGECTEGGMTTLAHRYASDNAKDNLAHATVCGFVPANPAILGCDALVGNLTDCIGSRPAPRTSYVEVRTTTETAGGKLPPVFAGAITGTDGVEVAACSRVGWGPVASASTDIGMAISRDKFNEATDSGGVFQPPPADGKHDPAVDPPEIVLRLQAGVAAGTGGGASNGFVWTESGGGPACEQDFVVGTTEQLASKPGTPSGCGSRLEDVVQKVQPVTVGIYEDAGSGEVLTVGIAIFVITGWFKPTGWNGGPGWDSQKSSFSTTEFCTSGLEFCLYGYFTTKLFATGTGSVSADNFGATYLKTIG